MHIKVFAFVFLLSAFSDGQRFNLNGNFQQMQLPLYSFELNLRDEISGTLTRRKEMSDGSNVLGSFRFIHPDGRNQGINYFGSPGSGLLTAIPENNIGEFGTDLRTPFLNPNLNARAFGPGVSSFLPSVQLGLGESDFGFSTLNSASSFDLFQNENSFLTQERPNVFFMPNLNSRIASPFNFNSPINPNIGIPFNSFVSNQFPGKFLFNNLPSSRDSFHSGFNSGFDPIISDFEPAPRRSDAFTPRRGLFPRQRQSSIENDFRDRDAFSA